jgi:parvulin-like peptidyl-prolyl isomerase
MNFRSLIRRAALAAAICAAVVSAPASAEDALPPGVIARVYGRDIRESDLDDRLIKRWTGTDRGKRLLEQLVDDTCVEIEAKKRGVAVTDDEVAAYVKHVDELVRRSTGNARTIDDVYKEQHTTPEVFARDAHEYLKRQKMAVEDLGGKQGEEVSEARLKLWLSSLRRRMSAKTTDLPDGVVAAVGDTTVDRARYAKALREGLPQETVDNARLDLALEAATEHALAEAKIVVTDADVDADLATLRQRFAKDPRVKNAGATFDDFLKQMHGTSEAELRTDRRYRASIGLERLLAKNVPDEAIRKYWEENRDAYGERSLVREIYVAAQEEGGKFKMRSFKDAFEVALRAKAAVLESSGGLGTTPQAGRKPLTDAVTAVAKQFEEDATKKSSAGEPIVWTHATIAGDDALTKAAFSGEVGTLLGPVKSRIGYHLLVVEERRPAPSYDEVKDNVREDLLRIEMSKFQMAMRADPNVVFAAPK